MPILSSIVSFVLRRILGRTREEAGRAITTVDIGVAYLKYFLKARSYTYSRLAPPNKTILFPLPDRWTNPTFSKSIQAPHLTVMQAEYTSALADRPQGDEIEAAKDRSMTNLRLMGNMKLTDPNDILTVKKIAS
jgi:hypothetical protein